MRSVARYPEVRDDGSMWVPLAPPPTPKYRRLSHDDVGLIGTPAVLSYSTEWVMDLRVFTDPYKEFPDKARWVAQLCDEGAWHDYERHGIEPEPRDRLVASTRLIFLLLDPWATRQASGE